MKKLTFLLTLSVLFLVGCSTEEVQITDSSENLNQEFSRGRVIHHVNAGGNDYCGGDGLQAGCDANYSLVANMHADGSVSGQFHDVWAGGIYGIHFKVDCFEIIDGNMAIVGGTITKGAVPWFDGDLAGSYAYTAVVDNGKDNNTPDQIAFVNGVEQDCSGLTMNDFILIDVTGGEVVIW